MTRLLSLTSYLMWLLAPLLWLQGRHVERTIERLPEALGDRRGSVPGAAPALGLLVLGDSTAAGVGAQTQDNALGARGAAALAAATGRAVNWQVVGRNGRKLAGVRRSLRTLLPEHSVDVVLLAVGVNDAKGWTRGRRWRESIEAVLDDIGRRFRNPVVIFSGLPPVHRFWALPVPLRQFVGLRAAYLDRLLQETVSGRPGVAYVAIEFENDRGLLAADGFHPGIEVYRRWSAALMAVAATRLAAR